MKASRFSAVAVSVALALASTFAAKADIQVFTDQAVELDQLISNNGSIQVGDKIFSGFSLIPTGNILPSQIIVTPIQDNYGWGLRFSSENMTAIGAQVNGFVLQFNVSVAPESNMLISDVHLRYNGASFGNGYSEVVETAIDPTTDNVLGQTAVRNPPPELSSGFNLSQPVSELTIVKDVRLTGDTGQRLLSDNTASISWIDQTFSQIPEPSAALLVVAGLFGLVLTTRRNH